MVPHKPRVSIGLPVFNGEKHLENAVTSILAQTYADFELIISDNASTDRTRAICLSYAAQDERVRYYRNDCNLGAAPNFNRAFMLASGEYFKWAPYDDLIAPDFLLRCVEALDNNPKAVLCYSKVKIIDEVGAFVVNYDPGPVTSSLIPHERFRNLILCPEYAVQQMGLVRSEALRKTALMGSYPASDEVFLAQLALLGDFHEIAERLYYYRRHAEQLTKGTQRSRILLYDTSLRGKILLPKWMYFFACLSAIRHAPLTGYDRAHCFGYMVRWILVPPNFRAMGKDVLLAAHALSYR